jgi:hypothetical protein
MVWRVIMVIAICRKVEPDEIYSFYSAYAYRGGGGANRSLSCEVEAARRAVTQTGTREQIDPRIHDRKPLR